MSLPRFIKAAATERLNPTDFRRLREGWILEDELPLYRFVKDHVARHRCLPSPDTLRSAGHALDVRIDEPASFYAERIRIRHAFNSVSALQQTYTTAMRERDMQTVAQTLRAMLTGMGGAMTADTCSSIAQSAGLVLEDYEDAKERPGLRGVTLAWPTLNALTLGAQNGDLVVIAGRPGDGKAQPMSAKIKTPDGWKLMGDMQVGDAIASPDGLPSEVTGVFPQGSKKVFKVTFKDGRTTECCAEHLWRIRNSRWVEKEKTLTTIELIEAMKCARNKGRIGVPLVTGDNVCEKDFDLHPYLVGVLIGDGCLMKSVNFTSADAEVVERVRRLLPVGYVVKTRPAKTRLEKIEHTIVMADNMKTYVGRRSSLSHELTRLGLWGKKSHQKTIPLEYMGGSWEQRMELLRGLFDTDGTVTKQGSSSFCTTSHLTALQVQELIRSVGGTAAIMLKKTTHRDAYIVSVRHPRPQELFTLERKRKRATGYQYEDSLKNVIVSVEPCGEKVCQCISVSHPSSLYVTDGYVVTHNTQMLLEMAYHQWLAGLSVLIVSMEMGALQLCRRWIGRHSGLNPNFIRSGELSTWGEDALRAAVRETQEGADRIYLLDGEFEKDVDGVEAMVREYDPDVVMIDGTYLLTDSGRAKGYTSKWETVSGVVNNVKKRICLGLNKPVIATFQFNRNIGNQPPARVRAEGGGEGTSGNEDRGPDLRDIAGTDAAPQDASIVLGTRRGRPPHSNDRRRIHIMKNREGDVGSFEIHYEFSPVNFSEVIPEADNSFTASGEWML